MSQFSNAYYTPYGAYELKATYQRNLLLGNVAVILMVAAILATSWLLSRNGGVVVVDTIEPIEPTVINLSNFNQHSIEFDRPAISGAVAPAAQVGIPVPMPDSAISDPDAVIMSQADQAALIDWGGVVDDGEPGTFVIDDNLVEALPDIDSFVYAETPAKFVIAVQPDYPRFAEQAGIEGDVWVKALVSEEGKVLKAVVLITSGDENLDEAARQAAFKNVFTPALQNGDPVPIWVTYKVEFRLED